ncbi:hypothetical protein NGR_c12370 [Sinorhizobium fredii NGR234]|uniref:Transmembrane protein n=1 Tax=Sinorhizobium fredii (strain NBRC 101917 / NGR234) TaxID=394 RepID=C3MB25_SINFN|nr:hypothetical protein [Sinorhizobium fredii]ACP25018.1 hypothetical protein NGR_c12370 [Sinorhizobium fredii NGR234]
MAKYLDERGDPATATHDADRETFSAEEAKQGRSGTAILAVLLGGLLLAFVVWGGVAIWGESTDSDRTTETEQVQPAPSTEQTGSVNQDQSAPAIPAPTDRDPTAQTGTGGDVQQVTPDGTEK